MAHEIKLPEEKYCRTQRLHGVDAHWCKVREVDPNLCEYSDALLHDAFFCSHPKRKQFEKWRENAS